jgi:Replication initiation factor
VKRITNYSERESTMKISGILGVEAGVDWITLTGQGFHAWERVKGMAETVLFEEAERGNKIQHFTRHGFSLSGCGGIQYGRSSGDWMVILSSERASKFWMPFAAYSNRCSRIDLQATIWYNSYNPTVVEEVYDRAMVDSEGDIARKITFIKNQRGGDTLYVGSRASAQFGRVYDKYAQQRKKKQWEFALRYEVEYKKPLSGETIKWLLKENPDSQQIASSVFTWFSTRGIHTPQITTNGENAIQFPERTSPLANKIEWLRRSVRPVYNQLRMAGFQTEADEALGVTENIQNITLSIKE